MAKPWEGQQGGRRPQVQHLAWAWRPLTLILSPMGRGNERVTVHTTAISRAIGRMHC